MGGGEVEVAEERRRMRAAALGSARRFVELAEAILGPVTAVVVGSYARGDFNAWSDVDLLVVSPNFDRNPLRRFDQLSEALKAGPALEVIPLTPEEFERQVRLRTPLAEEALTVGVVIRDGLGLLKRSERPEPEP